MTVLDKTQKQSDGEDPVMQDLLGMLSTRLLSLLPSPLWLGMVATETVIPMGQLELFDIQTECKQMTS